MCADHRWCYLCWIILLGLAGVRGDAVEPRPYTEFLRDLTELPRLAVLPVPGETCKQFSSYDRRSVAPDQPGWNANKDWGNFLRHEADGEVLAEMDGPGCVVRLWSANPAGTLKVYIDGAATPTWQCDFAALTKGLLPEVPPPITGLHALGANSYLPIPYQQHCKILVSHPGGLYYAVDYRTYPPEMPVESFTWPLTPAQQAALQQVNVQLSRAGEPPYMVPGMTTCTGEGTASAGGATPVFQCPGPAAITALKIATRLPADPGEARAWLNDLQLRITFDGEQPQVLTPLSDFFGTSPGWNPYRSLPAGVVGQGGYVFWYMPFAAACRMEIVNIGPHAVPYSWEITTAPLTCPFTELMYFHAGWHESYPNTEFDWPLLETTGRGRYVGTALSIWNPTRGWWGEGDEKVWVDDETFPSWYGTGSEDYFGYAWGSTQRFSHAFHAQPLAEGPGNANYTSDNRWHIADNIPFQQHFRMTIENYAQVMDYAVATFWYQAPATLGRLPARPLHAPRQMPYAIPGALEGEDLAILANTIAEVGPQEMGYFGGHWSHDRQLWLRPAQPGEYIELVLPVPDAGRYRIYAYLTKAVDYGIVQFTLNGTPLGTPFDGYHHGVIPSGKVLLGAADLPAGTSTLRLTIIGKNPKARGLMAGLDAVLLQKE